MLILMSGDEHTELVSDIMVSSGVDGVTASCSTWTIVLLHPKDEESNGGLT